ncbi:HNH endonuclease [Micromonospora sp. RTGN7]|uniref:HNH endonuclease n=1 Tax=Micromonospora sp. RTGN7 TaxID=3016526 RepID=UPI0029FF0F8A|nr:HNH endonuclease [Micromonospora sp. RTGN7]
MPYWLETDTFHTEPVWEVLAGGVADLIDALQSALCRLKSTSASVMSDGYLTEGMALQQCRGRKKILGLLTTGVLDQPPLLHRQGDECECLGDGWITGYVYRIHGFSKRNPNRREYNRNRAQKADLRDARLKALVYTRDGGCCRYCGSGPLSPKSGRAKDPRKRIHYDHVDPDQPAGANAENFVLACKRCNEHKGHRLPGEADMVLLPIPTPEQAAHMRTRAQVLHDLPTDADQKPNTDETTPNHDHDQKPIADRTDEPITEHDRNRNADPTPPVRLNPDTTTTAVMTNHRAAGSGLGRGGEPEVTPSPPAPRTPWSHQPARSPEHPDIYHRRSRAPGPTDPYIWPPGAVPAPPPPEEAR